ncbi:ABC transporter substrate-binding protein [Mesorhizobium sp. M0119]
MGGVLLPKESSAQSPTRGGKLIVGVKGGSSTDSLDPVLLVTAALASVAYQYGNHLIERTPEGEVKGELAESWEPLDGGKRWVIKLRQGVKFHNGKELTSADVVYSLDRHRGPNSKSPVVALMKRIDDIKADGPYQLTISLKEPDVGLPYLLTQIYLVVQPKDESPDRGIGTGPYVLDKAEPGKLYTFHRNPNYFMPNSAWFDELEVLVINDDSARISALLSGSVHLITEVPPKLVAPLKNAASVNIVSSPSTTSCISRCSSIHPHSTTRICAWH